MIAITRIVRRIYQFLIALFTPNVRVLATRRLAGTIRVPPPTVHQATTPAPQTRSRQVVSPQCIVTPARTASSNVKERILVEPTGRQPRMQVSRDSSPYWQDAGWVKSGDHYEGNFLANNKTYQGTIVWDQSHGLRGCFVRYPPTGLWSHPHGPCFSHTGGGLYSVHFNTKPRDVDGAIIQVQNILAEVN
jgi:hypothetical protein